MTHSQILSYGNNGLLEDISDPDSLNIDFKWIAAVLARMPRWNAKNASAVLSNAQHMVQGADALISETGDIAIAGRFLVHDAHEVYLQDETRPVVELISRELESMGVWPGVYQKARDSLKQRYDSRIYNCLGKSDLALDVALILPSECQYVKDMDKRMAIIEASELFNVTMPNIAIPHVGGDRIRITPVWSPEYAESQWLDRLSRYCGWTC